MVTSFEKSNPGYVFDWNEASLVGKKIGIIFRNEEWEYEGKTGWTVRPFKAISVDSVRNGDFTLPKDKPLKKKDGYGYATSDPLDSLSSFSVYSEEDDGDLPF